jgi:hypothetical protein
MDTLKIFACFLSLPLLSLFAGSQAPQGEMTQAVSMVQLIATPERFEGKRVSVIGFLQVLSESIRLYSHQEDERNGIFENSLWVDRTKDMGNSRQSTVNMKYVRIIGRLQHGKIVAVSKCELWSDPDHPFSQRIREMPGVSPNM